MLLPLAGPFGPGPPFETPFPPRLMRLLPPLGPLGAAPPLPPGMAEEGAEEANPGGGSQVVT
jgi:hypothetical protein